ncbi:tetratricopeptide repeat-containing serine protease family protein [uncultured Polaribacter sp.]|uniref:tetratricopeptide repeat-containing S1 family peptidase n=1 Tax=uncultured Polaribacter sp. TaxID=174711 RepID=UPI00261E2369|nr:tetratricopeptide repeat-containing serine protease family protein [uncultured Polaribacter sp.]
MVKIKIFFIIILAIPFSLISQSLKENLNKHLKSNITIFQSNNAKKYGSGYILEKGKVITNLHVIEGLTNGYVVINGTNKKHKISGYLAIDNQNDLAILSVPTLDGIAFEMAESTPKIGDKVYTFENSKNSSKIILEGKVEYISLFNNSGIIKTTISTFPGNSGSAVINEKGKVIGILFAGGFIKSNKVNSSGGYVIHLKFLKEIIKNKNNKTKELNLPYGAYHYLNKGTIAHNFSNFNEAISEINKSIKINSNLPLSYHNRGLVKLKLGQIESAISDFKKSIELDPKFANAYYNLGLANSILKKHNIALTNFNNAIDINPFFANAYSSRGMTKASLNDFNNALLDCSKAINIEPNNALFYITRGGINYFSNNKNSACSDFEKAKKLGNPNAINFINKFCK